LGVIAWNTSTWFYNTRKDKIFSFLLPPALISCWLWHCHEFPQKRRGTTTRLQITHLTIPTNILIALWRDAAAFHAASESWFCRLQRKLLVGLNNAQAKRATAGYGSPESSNQVEKLLLAKPRRVRWSFAWTLRPDIYLKRLGNWLIKRNGKQKQGVRCEDFTSIPCFQHSFKKWNNLYTKHAWESISHTGTLVTVSM
jgi:hypothetical protein